MIRIIILIGLHLLAVSASPKLTGQPSGLPSGELSKEASIDIFNLHTAKLFDKDAEIIPIEQVEKSLEIVRYLDENYKYISGQLNNLERLLTQTNCQLVSMNRKSNESKLFVDEHPNLRGLILKNLAEEIIRCIPDWFENEIGGPIVRKIRYHVDRFEFNVFRGRDKWRPLMGDSIIHGLTELAQGEVGNESLVKLDIRTSDIIRRFEKDLKNLVTTPCRDFVNQWMDVAGVWFGMATHIGNLTLDSKVFLDQKFNEFIDDLQICYNVIRNPIILQAFVNEKYQYLINELEKTTPEATLTSSETEFAIKMLLYPLNIRIDEDKFSRYLFYARTLTKCQIGIVKQLYQLLEVEQNGNLRVLLRDSAHQSYGVCLRTIKANLLAFVMLDQDRQKDYIQLDKLVSSIDREREKHGRGSRFYDELTESDLNEGLMEYSKQPKCYLCGSSNIRKSTRSQFKKVCKHLAKKLVIDAAINWVELVKLDVDTATNDLNANLEQYLKRGLICNWINTL